MAAMSPSKMAEVAISKNLFADALRLIGNLRPALGPVDSVGFDLSGVP